MTIIIVQCCHIVLSWLSFILPSHRPTVLTVFCGPCRKGVSQGRAGNPLSSQGGASIPGLFVKTRPWPSNGIVGPSYSLDGYILESSQRLTLRLWRSGRIGFFLNKSESWSTSKWATSPRPAMRKKCSIFITHSLRKCLFFLSLTTWESDHFSPLTTWESAHFLLLTPVENVHFLSLAVWDSAHFLSLILAWESAVSPSLNWGPNRPFRCLDFAQFVGEDSWKCLTSVRVAVKNYLADFFR